MHNRLKAALNHMGGEKYFLRNRRICFAKKKHPVIFDLSIANSLVMKFSIRTHGKAINHLAWGVVRKYGMTWKQAYDHAIKALSIKDRLTTGVVEFSFTKLDGTHRDAKGTRDLSLIPSAKHPKGSSTKPETTNVVSFYCLTSDAWKSFDITTLNPA